MILYHGTSAKYLDQILEQGIQPTETTNQNSNWDVHSAPDRVYLTDTYPLYFAITAAMELDSDAVIIEVEVDESELVPDEDFLAQATRVTSNLIDDTQYFRDNLYTTEFNYSLSELAEKSLEGLGTACIKCVKPEHIIRYTVIPESDLVGLVLRECDPTITLANHKFCGHGYKDGIKSIMQRYPTTELQK